MNNGISRNTIRIIILILIQVLVLKSMETDNGVLKYVNIIIFPLGILLLPIRTSPTVVLLAAFFSGFFVDIFYDSLGVHASATVFMAFLRPYVLNFLEPREGYNVDYSPSRSHFGLIWFLQYTGILLAAYLFFYFSIEAFTFVFILNILVKTILSFIISMLFVLFYVLIFDNRRRGSL